MMMPEGCFLYALDNDKLKPRPVYKERQGGNGFGISDKQVAYTIDTTIVHGVAICGCNWEHKTRKESSYERTYDHVAEKTGSHGRSGNEVPWNWLGKLYCQPGVSEG